MTNVFFDGEVGNDGIFRPAFSPDGVPDEGHDDLPDDVLEFGGTMPLAGDDVLDEHPEMTASAWREFQEARRRERFLEEIKDNAQERGRDRYA